MQQNTALLGGYIRILREARKWSLRDLAEQAGISHTTVDNIEKGYDPRTGRTSNITLETLGRLSAALGVSSENLLACLHGKVQVHLTHPMEEWAPDHLEDFEQERSGVREYLRLKYGRAEFVFPEASDDEATAKRYLFGATPPTDAEWEQVKRFVKVLRMD